MRSYIILFFFTSCVNCYKILGVYPFPSRSHCSVGYALMDGLAAEGHQVTVLSPFSRNKSIKNYTEIVLEHSWNRFESEFLRKNCLERNRMHFWDIILHLIEIGVRHIEWVIESDNFKNLLKSNEKFDVIIVELVSGESLLGLGHHFNAPVIVTSSHGAFKFTTDLVATPIMASFVPNTFNCFTDRMNFFERGYNSLSYWFEDIVMPLFGTPAQQKLLEQLFPNAKNMPTIDDLKRNVSLVLLNTHIAVGTPRPYASNMIEVGGMHIKQSVDPLPENIQKFLDEAKDGAIYFAFGSAIKYSKLADDDKNAIINAFAEYPNVRIIMKNDENIVIPSHKKTDVLIQSWLPQQSILAHPNIKIFLTHGGLLSTLEAAHFGVPQIGIPFVFDQGLNIGVAEQKGYAISVPFEDLSEDSLKAALRKMLTNSSYAKNAKIVSEQYRDQLKTPLQTAIHWVKHVAKNKGAAHMRMVAVELPFYKLYNLDVWAFIILIIDVVVFLLVKITYKICSSAKQIKLKNE